MIALLASVFVSSLLGSLHCAGMCGGIVCAVSSPGRALVSQAAWHAGRGAAYVLLGVAAGLAGRGVESALDFTGVRHVAAIAAGVLLVASGGAALVGRGAGRPPRPAPWSGALAGAIRTVRVLPLVPRALLVGSLTALVPCGWLWAFVATAAGTGRPELGALVMLTFWAGTLPLLAGLGLAAGRALAPLRRRLPLVSAAAMVAIGLLTLAIHFAPHDAAHDAAHGTVHAHPSLASAPAQAGHTHVDR